MGRKMVVKQTEVVEKIYAGLLGMNAGIRLGAPVEPGIWTYQRIASTYGDVTGYLRDYSMFAADDDANGPVFFFRALADDAQNGKLTPQAVAKAWLNYARDGVGMFWWGGYGVSTEHTAYVNLKQGVPAPQSGSIAQNGKTMAEQIGGQIFIDTWGLACPGNPTRAAELGAIAASVSHDGEGLHGAKFFCAAIARAFVTSDIWDILQTALTFVPQDSLYQQVAQAVILHHSNQPDSWQSCYEMLLRDWGYDKYPGICHMVPNAGVCVLALLYGNGDLARTIEIATMCGWDTDCNAGNVGTVLGVANGLAGIPERYRAPINDCVVLSSVAGSLNILDLPTYAKELAAFAQCLAAGEQLQHTVSNNIHFDFDLPGSTHGMHISNTFQCKLRHSSEVTFSGAGSLEILFDRIVRGDRCKIFWKPFYTRQEFNDERYMPVFSPLVCSGNTVTMQVYLDLWSGNEMPAIAPYVRLAHSNTELIEGFTQLVHGSWQQVSFTIPDTQGSVIDEVGIVFEGYAPAKFRCTGRLFVDEFSITGKADYLIDFAKQKMNFASVTPFSHNGGSWSLVDGSMLCMSPGVAEAYTGRYYTGDVAVTTTLEALHGSSHLLSVRCQGAMRGVFGGLAEPGKVALYINDFGVHKLVEASYDWEIGDRVTLQLVAKADTVTLSVNGRKLLQTSQIPFLYGMVGCVRLTQGRTMFHSFAVKEL